MLHELTKTVLLIVTALFPIINPPAAGFIILSMVPRASSRERAHLAWRVTVNSFMVLVAALSVGAYVLSFFGISVPVLRVAGGTIIAISGRKLLQLSDAEAAGHDKTDLHLQRAPNIESRSFFPLTLPITVCPGAISVAIARSTGSPLTGLRAVHLLGVVNRPDFVEDRRVWRYAARAERARFRL